MNPGTLENSKILLDSGAGALIMRKDVLCEQHKILIDKKNKCSTIAGTFNTTFTTEIILKHPELNHYTEIYAKCHLIDKLLNYDLILGKDILHELEIMFTFVNKPITSQEVSISMKPPNCMTKNFFLIKEIGPVRNTTKRIKQILDAEYNNVTLKSIIMNSDYLKNKNKNSLLELLQKYKKIIDGSLGKETGSENTIESKEDAKPFPIPIIK